MERWTYERVSAVWDDCMSAALFGPPKGANNATERETLESLFAEETRGSGWSLAEVEAEVIQRYSRWALQEAQIVWS